MQGKNFCKDYRDNFFQHTNKLIDNDQFKRRNTYCEKGFTRQRKIGFKNLLLVIGRGMASSLQRELNRFYAVVQHQEYSIQAVTKGALCQARRKLKPEAFLELNAIGVRTFYEDAPYQIWKRHRLLAVDGSTLLLPSHPSVKEVFGEYGVGSKAAVKRSIARISVCYDVLNLLTLDAGIASFKTAEQAMLQQHLQAVPFKEGDLLLLDRGYPSASLMYSLQQRGIDFCIRMKNGWWKIVQAMLESGQTDKEVVFELPEKDRQLMQQFNTLQDKVRCRLVVVELENGEKQILCTSLLDKQQYTIADIKELYHFRWNVEEGYKLYKCRAGLEVFSGKTALAIKQDFLAKVYLMTACAILSFPIDKKVREESLAAKHKHPKQINRTNALAFCREVWPLFWIRKSIRKPLQALDYMLKKTTDIIRPGRKFKRKKEPKKRPPSMNYKQL